MLFAAGQVTGSSIGAVSGNITNSLQGVAGLVTAACYLGALVFGVTGALKWKAYSEKPDRTPIKVPITYWAIAVLLAGFPEFMGTGTTTLWSSDNSDAPYAQSDTLGAIAPAGEPSMPGLMAKSRSSDLEASEPLPNQKSQLKAVKHTYEVETKPELVAQKFNAILQVCESLQCEILSSSLRKTTAHQAALSVRIAPINFRQLAMAIEQSGTVAQHITAANDETQAIMDTQANLDNLKSLMDNLQTLTSRAKSALDLIALGKETLKVQTQIDTAIGIRDALSKKTTMIEVSVRITHPGNLKKPNKASFSDLPQAVVDSLINLRNFLMLCIEIVATLLPWAVFMCLPYGVAWLLRRLGNQALGRLRKARWL